MYVHTMMAFVISPLLPTVRRFNYSLMAFNLPTPDSSFHYHRLTITFSTAQENTAHWHLLIHNAS